MKEGTNDQTTIQNVGLQVITCRLCIILPGLIYCTPALYIIQTKYFIYNAKILVILALESYDKD